jgi:hypothetical protein
MSIFDSITDFFGNMDLDMNALGITIVVVFLFSIFLLDDPLKTGMNNVSLFGRIGAILLAVPIGYIIANKMINK